MSSRLHETRKTFEDFLADIEHQFPEEHSALTKAIEGFVDLYRHRLIPDRVAARTLRQLARYIGKKAADLHPDALSKRAETLRDLRNRLAHGKRPSPAELRAGYDSLWTALLKSAKRFNAHDLLNLLAYSLRTSPGAIPKSDDQARIISAFRAVFRAMPSEQQESVFTELLIRLFSEPEFADALSPRRPPRR
jgi:hypothetical protein